MMLGTAAIRSIAEMSELLIRRGAKSEMNRANMIASGKATQTATKATSAVPTSTEAIPILSISGCHCVPVKKARP